MVKKNKTKKKINYSLYANYHPKTSRKGLGYKNKEKALYTIEQIKNEPSKYQVSVINTMKNRAKYHTRQTKDMKKAIKIFNKWLKNNKK